jgi:hypothetical protein
MLVQENNFREMPDFVAIGKRFGFDVVYFSHLVNWGTFSDEQFAQQAVRLAPHSGYAEFVELLQDPLFEEQIVDLGNLTEARQSAEQFPLGMGTHGTV